MFREVEREAEWERVSPDLWLYSSMELGKVPIKPKASKTVFWGLRNPILRFSGNSAFLVLSSFCISIAPRAASTTLLNSANIFSPKEVQVTRKTKE